MRGVCSERCYLLLVARFCRRTTHKKVKRLSRLRVLSHLFSPLISCSFSRAGSLVAEPRPRGSWFRLARYAERSASRNSIVRREHCGVCITARCLAGQTLVHVAHSSSRAKSALFSSACIPNSPLLIHLVPWCLLDHGRQQVAAPHGKVHSPASAQLDSTGARSDFNHRLRHLLLLPGLHAKHT